MISLAQNSLIAGLVVCLGLVAPAYGVGTSTDSSPDLPADERRTLLAARFTEGNHLTVVTSEARGEGKLVRVLRCAADGTITASTEVSIDAVVLRNLQAFDVDGEMCVVWVDIHSDIWLARRNAERKVLLQNPRTTPRGWVGRCWLLETGEKRWLLVLRGESMPNPRNIWEVHTSYNWLYCYDLTGGEPRLCGKARLDDDKLSGHDVECAASPDGPLVWQEVYKRPRLLPSLRSKDPPRTLRVALWRGEGSLVWKNVFTAPVRIGLFLDYRDGSKALVNQLCADGSFTHGVADAASGSFTLMQSDYGYHLLSARAAGARRQWATAKAEPPNIVVRTFDGKFRLLSMSTFPYGGVVDFRLADDGKRLYLVTLRRDRISVQTVDELPCVPASTPERKAGELGAGQQHSD